MKAFLSKFGHVVRGVLSGFDRLFFRGTLRQLAYREGLQHYLWANRIPYKDFGAHSEVVTKELEEASLRQARQLGREIRYLSSSKTSPEEEAKKIADRDGIRAGPICVLRRVDPCMSFEIRGNRRAKKLEIVYRERQCMHLYHYQIHPVFGFMHTRIQTWFPFHVYVCINGHEWLARQMDQAGLGYQRRDNCFTWVEDLATAQELFDQQLRIGRVCSTSWPPRSIRTMKPFLPSIRQTITGPCRKANGPATCCSAVVRTCSPFIRAWCGTPSPRLARLPSCVTWGAECAPTAKCRQTLTVKRRAISTSVKKGYGSSIG
jgi:hypothetical protein